MHPCKQRRSRPSIAQDRPFTWPTQIDQKSKVWNDSTSSWKGSSNICRCFCNRDWNNHSKMEIRSWWGLGHLTCSTQNRSKSKKSLKFGKFRIWSFECLQSVVEHRLLVVGHLLLVVSKSCFFPTRKKPVKTESCINVSKRNLWNASNPYTPNHLPGRRWGLRHSQRQTSNLLHKAKNDLGETQFFVWFESNRQSFRNDEKCMASDSYCMAFTFHSFTG